MHRCLRIPEILQSTFENLVVDGYRSYSTSAAPPDGQALSRLAQTCTGFSDLALDILWKEQASLVPLLKMFPPHLWKLSLSTYREEFEFRSTITTADWTRVLEYACRIRKIKLVITGLDLTVLELLSLWLPAEYLLPNVRSLNWRPLDAKVFAYIRLFLGPKLTVLDTRLEPSIVHSSLVAFLASGYSLLTDVTLQWSSIDEVTLHAVSSLVSSLGQLQRLSVPHLDPSAYKKLATLSTLRYLALEDLIAFPMADDSWPSPAFPGLTFVEFGSLPLPSAVTKFLATLSDTPLKVFKMESATTPDNAFMRRLSPWTSVTHPGTLILTPLLAFSNLREVAVDSGFEILLTDVFCTALAIAWPRIEVLSIGNSYVGQRQPPTVGLLALTAFARHCPRLRRLAMDFDAREVPGTAPPPEEPRVLQLALQCLSVDHSPIDSPSLVARFLSVTLRTTTKRVEPISSDTLVELREKFLNELFTALPALRTQMVALSNTEFLKAIIFPRSTIALVAKFAFDVLEVFYAVPFYRGECVPATVSSAIGTWRGPGTKM
ncbi:hypothetical protein C8R46DRAFT_1349476 [Mycena filopes]|nr:hypothetical protein C8R46DRAFT_1349476 [Mycena filopes]